jgi:hypothetical protein
MGDLEIGLALIVITSVIATIVLIVIATEK